ncbi:MAG: M14 family zinc carboxypeptidase [Ilumatobacteraceae bacterium]
MSTFSQLLVTARRRSTRLAAGGLLAVPLLMQSCQPACVPAAPAPVRASEERAFGNSVQGRPLIASRLGDPTGVPVLVIGSIHGEEQAGIEIAEYIRDTAVIPAGYDVWVIRTINPDGNIANIHQNANGVDLNRNFGPNWEANDCAVTPRYCAGPAPLSEPESQAIAAFIKEIKPKMTVWYHGPLNVVDAATLNGVANPNVLTAYGAASGYGVATLNCNPTGRCVGNATQYLNSEIPGSSSFVVELSSNTAGAMTPAGVTNHVNGFFAAAAAAATP